MASDTNWTYEAVQSLRNMAREGLPLATISLKLKRPIESVRAKLDELGITPAASA